MYDSNVQSSSWNSYPKICAFDNDIYNDIQDDLQIQYGESLQIMCKYLKNCGVHIQTFDITDIFSEVEMTFPLERVVALKKGLLEPQDL